MVGFQTFFGEVEKGILYIKDNHRSTFVMNIYYLLTIENFNMLKKNFEILAVI